MLLEIDWKNEKWAVNVIYNQFGSFFDENKSFDA